MNLAWLARMGCALNPERVRSGQSVWPCTSNTVRFAAVPGSKQNPCGRWQGAKLVGEKLAISWTSWKEKEMKATSSVRPARTSSEDQDENDRSLQTSAQQKTWKGVSELARPLFRPDPQQKSVSDEIKFAVAFTALSFKNTKTRSKTTYWETYITSYAA